MTKRNTIYIVIALTILGIAGRLMYHIPNVTPVVAIALFISTYMGIRYSLPAILGMMFISDWVIGFYSVPVMISVYGSFIAIALLGMYLQKNKTFSSVVVTTLGSSLLFFAVTNYAVWQFGTMYAHTWAGIVQAYFLAIPFLKNSLLGDLFYTGALFGTYEFVRYGFQKKGSDLKSVSTF